MYNWVKGAPSHWRETKDTQSPWVAFDRNVSPDPWTGKSFAEIGRPLAAPAPALPTMPGLPAVSATPALNLPGLPAVSAAPAFNPLEMTQTAPQGSVSAAVAQQIPVSYNALQGYWLLVGDVFPGYAHAIGNRPGNILNWSDYIASINRIVETASAGQHPMTQKYFQTAAASIYST